MKPFIDQLGVVVKQLTDIRDNLTEDTETLENRLEHLLSSEVVAFKTRVSETQALIDSLAAVITSLIEDKVPTPAERTSLPAADNDDGALLSTVNNLKEIGERLAQVSRSLGDRPQTTTVPSPTVKASPPELKQVEGAVSGYEFGIEFGGATRVTDAAREIIRLIRTNTNPVQAAGTVQIDLCAKGMPTLKTTLILRNRSNTFKEDEAFYEWLLFNLRAAEPLVIADLVANDVGVKITFSFDTTGEDKVTAPAPLVDTDCGADGEALPKTYFGKPEVTLGMSETPLGPHANTSNVYEVEVGAPVEYVGTPPIGEIANTIVAALLQNLTLLYKDDRVKEAVVTFSKPDVAPLVLKHDFLQVREKGSLVTELTDSIKTSLTIEGDVFPEDIGINVTVTAMRKHETPPLEMPTPKPQVEVAVSDNPYRGHYVGVQSVFANYLSGRHYVGGRGLLSIDFLPLFDSAIDSTTLEKLSDWPTGFYIAENGDYQFLLKTKGGTIIVTDFGRNGEEAKEAPNLLIKGELISMDAISKERLPAVVNFIEAELMKLIGEATGMSAEQMQPVDVVAAKYLK